MMRPQPAPTVRKTPNFDFIFGSYSYSASPVPYFQIAMSFADAAQYLRLVTEMPGAAALNWRIEELFQRDIDWFRVERKIVPYLKQQNEPQFFNALTIALLPVRGASIHMFDEPGEQWTAPVLENSQQFQSNTRNFGPISCGYWQPWTHLSDAGAKLGQICWNTDEICGVAIDGQHRLAAIKSLAGGGLEAYRGTSVPVILVVLDPVLGYRSSQGRTGLIETLRRLFIDLNKHAQTVKRPRQILLDDRDPASICVRTLVGNQLQNGAAELAGTPPRMPLSLVDWHSEQALFDTGPYISTILGLDWIVANVLTIRPFQDAMAFDETQKLISRLEQRLGVDLSKAKDRLEECRKYERPFSFTEEPENELATIAEGFARKWNGPLLRLLTTLSPYAELIKHRDSQNTLRPEFANWCALRERVDGNSSGGRAAQMLLDFEQHLTNRDEDPISPADYREALKAFSELKTTRQLAFTVVFQRALVHAFLQFTKVSAGMVETADGDDEIELADILNSSDESENGEQGSQDDFSELEDLRATQLVAALNALIREEPEFLKHEFEYPKDGKKNYDRFWMCSFVSPGGPIDFTQSASRRSSDLLLLAGLFWIYQNVERVLTNAKGYEQLIERSERAQNGIDLKLNQCLGRLKNDIAARILTARDEDAEDEDACWNEVNSRAQWIWKALAVANA